MKTFGCFVGKSFLLGLASIALLSGCSLLPRFHEHLPGNRAFIVYWPPPENSKQLKLAVKDNIDVKDVVTTAGSELLARKAAPAEKDASCLAIARQRNVQIVGKANMSEFAVAPSGFNEYFGTPASPLNRWRTHAGAVLRKRSTRNLNPRTLQSDYARLRSQRAVGARRGRSHADGTRRYAGVAAPVHQRERLCGC